MDAIAGASSALRSRFRVPICPDLFGIFFGSGWDPRRLSRKLARTQAPRSLSALGRMRIWSGAPALGRGMSGY